MRISDGSFGIGLRLTAMGLLGAAGLLCLGVAGATQAHATCTAPAISLTPSTSHPGFDVTVSGGSWVMCHDTVITATPTPAPAPSPQSAEVHLTLKDGSAVFNLKTVTTDATGTFVTVVRIPTTAAAGSAHIGATTSSGYAATAPITITGGTNSDLPLAPAPQPAVLPQTGSTPVLPMAALAGALILCGGALIRMCALGKGQRARRT